MTLLFFVLGVLGFALGLFFLVTEWRTRGTRYISTVVLGLATAVMAGWLRWGYEAPRKPKDYENVKNRVVRNLDPAKASRITITRLGKTAVFEKQASKWTLVQPVQYPADHDAVENLLTELKMLDKDKTLAGPRTKAEFGLVKDAIVVKVEGATPSPLTLTLGGPDVTGAKIYLALNADAKVLVVNKHVRETFDKDPDELRDSAALGLKATAVKKLELLTEDGQRATLEGKDKVWTLRLGAETFGQRANAKTVDDLARKLQDLRATRFLGDGAAALTKHGLAADGRSLAADDGEKRTLLLGGPCPDHRDEIVAGRSSGKTPVVFCLRAKEVKDLTVKPDELRDARLTGITEMEVAALSIQAGGKEVVLKKKGMDWEVEKPADAKEKKVEVELLEKFVKDLQAHTVMTFLPPPAEGLAAMGLDKPRATITLTDEGGRKEEILLGAENADKNVYARRSGEQLVVVVHREAAALFEPTLLRFRKLSVLSFSRQPNEAVELTGRSGAVVEEAVFEGGIWNLKKPEAMATDADAFDVVLGLLAELKVQRFVAPAPLPEHGLATPTRILTVKIEKEEADKDGKMKKTTKVVTIKVGADAPSGGCYGRIEAEGEPVFLVEAAQCTDLRALWATRRLADLRTTQIQEVKITRGGGTEHLEKRGTKWARVKGPLVASTAVEDLLTTVAGLRALRVVSYGAPAGFGLDKPTLTLQLVSTEKDVKPVTIRIGDAHKEDGKVVGHHGIVEGRNVTYLLPLTAVEAILKTKF
jgi:hypothetical protein